MINTEQAWREEIRWRILKSLDISRPLPLTARILQIVLDDINLTVTMRDLNRETDYLRAKGLLMREETKKQQFLFTLTSQGVDLLEGNIPCPAGIACPEEDD